MPEFLGLGIKHRPFPVQFAVVCELERVATDQELRRSHKSAQRPLVVLEQASIHCVLLRPFDGVTPYRLEMQAQLSVDGHSDLYDFWGAKLADQLAAETDLVLDLASKEYSRAVEPHLPPAVRFLTCTFGELKGGKLVEKGTMCKMARGQMVRWLAENNVTDPENIKNFADLDYRFSGTRSTENNYVFIREREDGYGR